MGSLRRTIAALSPFASYIAAILLLAAAGSYPLYALIHSVFAADVEFQSVLKTLLKLIALAGLWPLMRALDLRGREPWGYGAPPGRFVGQLVLGLALGVGTLGVLAACLVLLGIRVPAEASESLGVPSGDIILGILVTALLIGGVEETWFRGALQSAASRYVGALRAGAVVALFYAAVHFVHPHVGEPAAKVNWWTGFEAIAHGFQAFKDPASIDSFLALVSAGFLLALLRIKTGSIALSIGVHAGWVMVIKGLRESTNLNESSRWSVLVGGYDGVIGYLAVGWFALLIAGYLWLFLRPLRG